MLFRSRVVRLSELAEIDKLGSKEIEYKVNTHNHGMDLRHHIDSFKNSTGLDYRRTRAILENLFRRNEGNRRYKLLNLSLKEFYSFIINNAEQLKNDLREFEGERYKQMNLLIKCLKAIILIIY